jgi:putative hydrolase of the HAD superfamily
METRPLYRAITFDAAGTLIRVAEPVGETYARIAEGVGATLSPAALDAAFREVFPAMPPMAFPDLEEPHLRDAERGWWQDLVGRVVAQAGGIDAFDDYFDALFAYYAAGAAWRAYPEAHGVLESVRRRGLRVGVVSNFDSRLPPILRELGLTPLMDTIVYSTGCGAAKPSPRIFHHALERLGATPGSTLHVGDSLSADFNGAGAAGLKAVHLNRPEGIPDGVFPVIRHLGELEGLLDQRL